MESLYPFAHQTPNLSDMGSTKTPLILVTTDFTEVSDFAIDNAVRMARILNGKLLILHIIDKYTRRMLKKEEKGEDFVDEKLKKIAGKIEGENGIEVIPLVEKGNIFKVIAGIAKKHDALLHFLGTHGKKGIQWIIGSFALKVVKRSPVPVIVIQKKSGNINYRKFVFPLDLQPGSKQKVKWAKILYNTAGSRFDIIVENYGDDYNDRKLKADLKQLMEIMDYHSIPYTTTFSKPRGSFANQTIAFAGEQNADVIMITSDPDKLTWNPFNKEEERVLYNEEKIPVMFINSKNLRLVIGGP